MPPLLADFTHARPCKPFCEKYLTLPPEIQNGLYRLINVSGKSLKMLIKLLYLDGPLVWQIYLI
ncbi:Uncharacterised protein [Faecalicoccus pleomorphus]|uniref:Uncharacterized protein n=1 Tax=Faecalicoccus pleomorphus TaxID=1323 RepID=A0A380LKX0_9FIRM|nr:Uncharacterised protein [Faecalicoccus pleomorphus]